MQPLVLVPGIQGRWEWMQPTIEALSADWRVISCSLPGEPDAGAALNGSFDSLVDHVDRVVESAGTDRAVVCGVSFGGLIALRYAARRPERVRALVLVSTPGPRWQPKPEFRRYMQWPTLAAPIFFARSVGRFWPELRETFPDAGARLRFCASAVGRVLRAPAVPTRMSRRAQLAAAENFERDCAAIGAPTLVVTGECALDRVVDCRETLDYVSRIRGAQHQVLPRTGHLGVISAPAQFAAIVSQFASRI